jgi:hypothetical protein
MGLVLSIVKNFEGIKLMRRSIFAAGGTPKLRLFTTRDRFAIGGLMLWYLDRISMWKFPGTLMYSYSVTVKGSVGQTRN